MSTSRCTMCNTVGLKASVFLYPKQLCLTTAEVQRLTRDWFHQHDWNKPKDMPFWRFTKPKSMSLKFTPFLVWLFSCDIKRASSLLPKGICPFYLVRRMLQLFAFLNCLAAQACSVCAVWNVSLRHVTAVLKLMLDFLQQIWIMLKSVLNWRGYVNNSQMGISVLSSREMQAVYGRSKCLAGPSFCH